MGRGRPRVSAAGEGAPIIVAGKFDLTAMTNLK